ncbi:MAG TPA: GLPGLI family protein [Sphingobacteriaceae bacterium]
MRKLKLVIGALLVLFADAVFAQYARFPAAGTIEFEKTVNMYALIKKRIGNSNDAFYQQAFDAYKKSQPQFKRVKSTLSFAGNKTLFAPDNSTEATRNFFSDEPLAGQPNIIFTDLSNQSSITQKSVFEETFLVKDSVRQITWKITDETREIAGYPCRRANALVMDSIYVVAFYTDKIPVSGGPESFTGLPGMILGVALPHENVTWFATKVTDAPVAANTMIAPKKGKATDLAGLVETLKDALKNWGNRAQASLKALLL